MHTRALFEPHRSTASAAATPAAFSFFHGRSLLGESSALRSRRSRAGKAPHHRALAIQHLHHHIARGRRIQVIIDLRARQRILRTRAAAADSAARRPRRANALARREQRGRTCRRLRLDLLERRQIVENPESAPLRRDHEVLMRHLDIGDRRHRQVHLERLPVPAVIERNVNAEFRSRV